MDAALLDAHSRRTMTASRPSSAGMGNAMLTRGAEAALRIAHARRDSCAEATDAWMQAYCMTGRNAQKTTNAYPFTANSATAASQGCAAKGIWIAR